MPRPAGYETLIIAKELEDLPYYEDFETIKEIHKDIKYLKRLRSAKLRIEALSPYYAIIQFSKFPLVLEAISITKSWSVSKFVWIDGTFDLTPAGASRFFNGIDVDAVWNGSHISDRLMIKAFPGLYTLDHRYGDNRIEEIIWGDFNEIAGWSLG